MFKIRNAKMNSVKPIIILTCLLLILGLNLSVVP